MKAVKRGLSDLPRIRHQEFRVLVPFSLTLGHYFCRVCRLLQMLEYRGNGFSIFMARRRRRSLNSEMCLRWYALCGYGLWSLKDGPSGVRKDQNFFYHIGDLFAFRSPFLLWRLNNTHVWAITMRVCNCILCYVFFPLLSFFALKIQ